MKKVKSGTKGITLISLVITVMVLLILASIGTYSGVETVKSSKFTAFSAGLKIMQTEVNSWYQKSLTDGTVGDKTGTDILSLGTELSTVQEQVNKVFTAGESGITDTTGYRYFNNDLVKQLGVEGVDGDFFINISKRSVVSYEGMEYEGKTYYTVDSLPDGFYNVEYNGNSGLVTFDVKATQTSDENYRVTISNIKYDGNINKWYVQYKKEGSDSWSTVDDLEFTVIEAGRYVIRLYNGDVAGEQEVKVGREKVFTEESYIGWYADLNNDGQITLEEDGIIYADQEIGGSGQCTDADGTYTIPQKENVKEYTIISETSTLDPFNTGKGIIQLAGESSAEDRFYVMTLQDIDNNQHQWYGMAWTKMTDYATATSGDFGTGKTNTEAMIAKRDKGSVENGGYGAKNPDDMWGLIKTEVSEGWFVPSRGEWSAFAQELGIPIDYASMGLSYRYWSSSQKDTSRVYLSAFGYAYMSYDERWRV